MQQEAMMGGGMMTGGMYGTQNKYNQQTVTNAKNFDYDVQRFNDNEHIVGPGGDLDWEDYSRVERRKEFQNAGVTNEYYEKNYYELKKPTICVNKFYLDFLEHVFSKSSNKGFLSQNFIYSKSNMTEIILVLALMDLPFVKSKLQTGYKDQGLEITAGGNLMVFCKEVVEMKAEKNDNESELLISQKFFDAYDRYKKGTSALRPVELFEIGRLYGSRVAITNTSDSELQINVLTEVPEGSVPIAKLDYFVSTTLNMQPLKTEIIEFYFYFPKSGEFKIYPASITRDTDLLANAQVAKIKVLDKITIAVDTDSMMDVISRGNKEDI